MAKAKAKNGDVAVMETVEESSVTTDGIPVNKKGAPDKRYRFAPGTRPERRSSGLPAGQAKAQRLQELLGGRSWEYVEDGYDANGVESVTGTKLKKFFIIRDSERGETVTVGRGEMIKYAGVEPPKKVRGRSSNGKASEEFENAFVDETEETTEETTEATTEASTVLDDDDLDFLDEPA
jgi:hypothetical protein